MAKTIRMADMPSSIACFAFEAINKGKLEICKDEMGNWLIVTNMEPKDLNYPEGWYYAKGNFRNKHMTSSGFYTEVPIVKKDGEYWEETAKYCTLDD